MQVKLKLKREDVRHLHEIVNYSRFERCLCEDEKTIKLLNAKDKAEAYAILNRISYTIYHSIDEALRNNPPKGE